MAPPGERKPLRRLDKIAVVVTTSSAPGHAFISYVHEDAESVDTLCEVLEAAGITVWRDRDQLWPGDDWKVKIRHAIRQDSLAFIACFSGNSVAKDRTYQNEELLLAVEEYRMRPPGRPWLFPIRFSEMELPEYDLGAGRTLDALQRTDLFGPKREPELTRLAMSILRVVGAAAEVPIEPKPDSQPNSFTDDGTSKETGTSTSIAQENKVWKEHEQPIRTSASALVKLLLRDPTKDIELDDYVTELADNARQQCMDTIAFPTSSDAMRSTIASAHLVIERVDNYWEIMAPLAEVLAVGCAWGTTDEQDALWARAMRTIANTTPMASGHTSLIDLRVYPRIMALYAAGLGAVARNKYSALRAVTVDATYRDRERGRIVPVVAVCHTAGPFANAPFLASAVAINAEAAPITDEKLEALSRGIGQMRITPTSDDLHARLRKPLQSVVRDDDDYSDLFDRLEVLLGVIAEDATLKEKADGGYLEGGWVGRYIWRDRYGPSTFLRIHEEFRTQGTSWPPLAAGLFGNSEERAENAFASMSETLSSRRRIY
jgi:hypothetical protein